MSQIPNFPSLLSRNQSHRPNKTIQIVPREALKQEISNSTSSSSSITTPCSPSSNAVAGKKKEGGDDHHDLSSRNTNSKTTDTTTNTPSSGGGKNMNGSGGSGGSGGGSNNHSTNIPNYNHHDSTKHHHQSSSSSIPIVFQLDETTNNIVHPLSPSRTARFFKETSLYHQQEQQQEEERQRKKEEERKKGQDEIHTTTTNNKRERITPSHTDESDQEDDKEDNNKGQNQDNNKNDNDNLLKEVSSSQSSYYQTTSTTTKQEEQQQEEEQVYYIVGGDDRLSNPHPFNSTEYIMEQLLSNQHYDGGFVVIPNLGGGVGCGGTTTTGVVDGERGGRGDGGSSSSGNGNGNGNGNGGGGNPLRRQDNVILQEEIDEDDVTDDDDDEDEEEDENNITPNNTTNNNNTNDGNNHNNTSSTSSPNRKKKKKKYQKNKIITISQRDIIEDPAATSMSDSYSFSTAEQRIAEMRKLQGRRRAEELAYHLCTSSSSSFVNQDRESQEDGTHNSNNGNDGSSSKDEKTNVDGSSSSLFQSLSRMDESERFYLERQRKKEEASLPPAFHEVELGDWEKQIDWEGFKGNDDDDDESGNNNNNNNNEKNGNGVVGNSKSGGGNTSGSGGGGGGDAEKKSLDAMDIDTTSSSSKGAISGSSSGSIPTSQHRKKDTTASSSLVATTIPSSLPKTYLNPQSILSNPVNPYLDSLDFLNYVSWEGADAAPGYNKKLAEQVGKLILQDKVAGSSVAKSYSINGGGGGGGSSNSGDGTGGNNNLHPLPFNQSDVFQKRMERQRSNQGGPGSMGTMQVDVTKREQEIKERQEKRAHMAERKKERVQQAMKTVVGMGDGKGRTITSSLMGPGGTERTGRPSQAAGPSSLVYEKEYVEELEMVYKHSFVKPDLRSVELRNFNRPKLPRRSFTASEILPWQLQIRISINPHAQFAKKLGGRADVMSQSISFQPKILNEADLSPAEGSLVLLEYSEEVPPIQLSKGMASRIVNYFRGDRSKCPISIGGGDRPTRKKKHGDKGQDTDGVKGGTGKAFVPPRLQGPTHGNAQDNMTHLIGKIKSKKTEATEKGKLKESSVKILPEGVTVMLHKKDSGPFLGEVKEGTQTGLVSNAFFAPIFQHKANTTDFLMIIGKKPNNKLSGKLGVVLRPMPTSVFCVGQIEPRIKVFTPSSGPEKDFLKKFQCFHIAKGLQLTQHGMKIDEIESEIFPNTDSMKKNSLRQLIKEVAEYDKNTQIWTLKREGELSNGVVFDGVEALGRLVTTEGVAAYESACASVRRLRDFGILQLCTESNSVANVNTAMMYRIGSIAAARKRLSTIKKRTKAMRKSKQAALYSKVEEKLTLILEDIKHKGEVARFIQEELLLSPWNLTSEFIDIRKNENGMMKLTGLGDPSGTCAAFNFLRENEPRPSKAVAPTDNGAGQNKITGTENDLRKLSMKQMEDILLGYDMHPKEIKKLKRWDRVHVIRDYSTKNFADSNDDGFGRYARGEKQKLTDQKKNYRKRIQTIWEAQRAALTADAHTKLNKETNDDEDDDDSDSDDDSNFDDFDQEEGEVAKMREANEEERKAQEGMNAPEMDMVNKAQFKNRNVIKRKIIKRHPDGREEVHFKFIIAPEEVEKIIQNNKKKKGKTVKEGVEGRKGRKKRKVEEYDSDSMLPNLDSNVLGHTLFESDDDEIGKTQRVKRKGRVGKRKSTEPRSSAQAKKAQTSQAGDKQKTNQQEKRRQQKRKRDAEERELYSSNHRHVSTSSRRERGSARDSKPHVIMADQLEQIRSDCEKRPDSRAFHRPVNMTLYPTYYETISNPIDLQSIRDKIKRYEYKNAEMFVNDFEIMKNNAIKFNGIGTSIGNEATAIYEFVKSTVTENRDKFDKMEQAVSAQSSQNSSRKKGRGVSPKNAPAKDKDSATGKGATNMTVIGGIPVNLGDDLKNPFVFDQMGGNDSS